MFERRTEKSARPRLVEIVQSRIRNSTNCSGFGERMKLDDKRFLLGDFGLKPLALGVKLVFAPVRFIPFALA